MIAKKTSKNQLTLPKDIVREFPEITYFDAVVENRRIILTPLKLRPAEITLENIREKIEKKGITQSDVDNAVKWARKKS